MRIRPFVSLVAVVGAALTATAAEQTLRLNRTIDLLAQGRATFGILSHDRSLDNARALARSGLDFVIVDMEHGPLDIETLRVFLLGMTDKERLLRNGHAQMDVTPLVRLPANGRDQAIGITTSAETVERRLAEGFNVVTVGFGDGGITPESARTLAIGRKASGR